MKNMLIAQSGGPTATIKASLSGAVKRAMKHPEIGEIYGARNGLEGLLEERFVDFRALLREEADFERLKRTPAMLLGSCRLRLSPEPDETYEKILGIFRQYRIGYFFYIGGNDSMDTVWKLSRFLQARGEQISVVGIPKTIDNDLACTDHTPGFGSAARYVATSVAEIACDSQIYTAPSVTIVEIMGRNAGWLTAAAVLARREGCSAPHVLCLPEVPFREAAILDRLEALRKKHRHLVVATSEGLRREDGSYLAAETATDPFGHRALSGVGGVLRDLVARQMGCKVRAVELNVLQRAASHLQSETDVAEACRIGAEAVTLGVEGRTGTMATLERVSTHPYLIRYGWAEIERVANIEKKAP